MFGDNLDSFEEEKSENNRESKKRKNFYYEWKKNAFGLMCKENKGRLLSFFLEFESEVGFPFIDYLNLKNLDVINVDDFNLVLRKLSLSAFTIVQL
jgi:hypothetical protein